MKLHIYNKGEIIKTYETDEFKLKWGLLEDLIEAIENANINSLSDYTELGQAILEILPMIKDKVNILLKEMFTDITDEDIREAAVDDIAYCLADAVKYVGKQMVKRFKRKN